VSPNRLQIAFGCDEGKLHLWDLSSSKKEAPETSVVAHEGHPITVLSYAPRDTNSPQKLLSAAQDGLIKVWNANHSLSLVHQLKGHLGFVSYAAFSLDGRFIASAGKDLSVRLWNAVTGESLAQTKGHTTEITGLCWLEGSKFFATISFDQYLRVWRVNDNLGISNVASVVSEHPPLVLRGARENFFIVSGVDLMLLKLLPKV